MTDCKALVTGATGFIGPHLVHALRERGGEVTCLRRPSSVISRLTELDVRFVTADVTQPDALPAAVQDVDVVYHLAGLTRAFSRRELLRVNDGGTRNLLAACASVANPPVVVIVSSIAAAGPARDRLLTEADPPAPISSYGHSKREAERTAEGFAASLPITVVRPPLVFGEGDDCVLKIFRPVRRWGVHLVSGLRDHRFSVLHAADLASALMLAAERGRRLDADQESPDAGYYFVASDEHPSYAELGRRIATALGRRTRVLHTPLWLTWAAAGTAELTARLRRRQNIFNWDKAREAAAGAWACSAQRARTELGWAPAADLDERLRQTVAWYRRHGWL